MRVPSMSAHCPFPYSSAKHAAHRFLLSALQRRRRTDIAHKCLIYRHSAHGSGSVALRRNVSCNVPLTLTAEVGVSQIRSSYTTSRTPGIERGRSHRRPRRSGAIRCPMERRAPSGKRCYRGRDNDWQRAHHVLGGIHRLYEIERGGRDLMRRLVRLRGRSTPPDPPAKGCTVTFYGRTRSVASVSSAAPTERGPPLSDGRTGSVRETPSLRQHTAESLTQPALS